jgi:DNA-binding response OmpR family regulator
MRYEVVTAPDGLEGPKIIEADRIGFDLVVYDLFLPDKPAAVCFGLRNGI